jgi:hypothetical protein
MALHIADPEVDNLVTQLARMDKVSKTEALRKLLRREVDSRTLQQQRQSFAKVANEIIAEARKTKPAPATKEEFDELWGI